MPRQRRVKAKANENTAPDVRLRPARSRASRPTTEKSTPPPAKARPPAPPSSRPSSTAKITTIIKQQKVERVEPSKLNISISVGARVPTSVRFYPLPSEVFVIYPEWRGYDYILVGDEILVINPRTHEIVAILDA